jgi:dsDNA-specific endonuclease/ATPase MutS2
MTWILGILILVALGYLWLRSGGSHLATATEEVDLTPPEDLIDAPLQDSIDLHGLPPEAVGPLVDAYVEEARRHGFPLVKSIHGRGIGALRQTVRVHLQRSPHVRSFQDAPPPSGRGATIAELHRSQHDIATQSDTH